MNEIVTKENQEKEKVKREKMASFFLDLAKLTFAAMVLGGMTPFSAMERRGIG